MIDIAKQAREIAQRKLDDDAKAAAEKTRLQKEREAQEKINAFKNGEESASKILDTILEEAAKGLFTLDYCFSTANTPYAEGYEKAVTKLLKKKKLKFSLRDQIDTYFRCTNYENGDGEDYHVNGRYITISW